MAVEPEFATLPAMCYRMAICRDCGGQFSLSYETLFKLRSLGAPQSIHVPPCIFCDSKKTHLVENDK